MNNFQAVGDYIDQVILGQKGVPSCDIMVKKEHQLLYRHTSGVSNLETKTPISPDARYFLYSCTKPVTVAVAMRLVEQGLLELDAPVAQYLPAFSQLTVKDGDVLRPARTPLTVRHLFTMTGGFDYTLRGEPAVDALLARQGEASTTLDVVNAFAQRPLHFEPGTHFRYSLCHDILAAVVEQIVGKPFHTYVQEVLFDPLGMTRSTFRCNDEILGSIADQYTFERGIMEPMEKNNEFLFTPNYDSGGAGLISCVEDYSCFADLMACGGTGANGYQLLRPETVRMLAEVQVANAMVQEHDYSIGCGADYAYGLGVRTRIATRPGSSPIGEFGWDGAAGSYVLMDPANQISIFLAMHVRCWPYCIGTDHQVLRDLVYAALGS